MGVTQTQFNELVRAFNRDYLELLRRAATTPPDGHLVCLFDSLVDGYDVINRYHDLTDVNFEISPYPLSLKGDTYLLEDWGFDQAGIENIQAFLRYFRKCSTRGMNLPHR